MTTAREALCAIWRERVDTAKAAYEAATAALEAAGIESAHLPRADSALINIKALQAQRLALAEFRRVLEIFHKVCIMGVEPDT